MSTKIKHRRFKPELITAGVLAVGVFTVLGILLSSYWMYLILAASSPVMLAGLMLAMGVILFMALDGPTRTLFRYMYMSLSRWVTGWFVHVNPVDVLHDNIKQLEARMRDMRIQRDKLRVEIHKIMELVRNNKIEIHNLMKRANRGQQKEDKTHTIINSRKAARKDASNQRLSQLLKKMQGLEELLDKMYNNAYIMVEDVKDRVELKVLEQEALTSGHSAMKNAMSILKGDIDQAKAFDKAMNDITEDVQGKIGKIEHFMDMSEHFINTIDLQNGIYEEKGLEMLEKWEKEDLPALDMEHTITGIHPTPQEASELSTQKNDKKITPDRSSAYDELLD